MFLPCTNNNYKRGRENETKEQRLSRLAKQRTRTENNRANETSLETQQRRQRDREHHAQSALQVRARLTNEHLSSTVSHSQIDRLNSCIQEVQQVAGAIRTPNRKRSVQRSMLSVVERLRGPEMHEAKRKAEESRLALNETRRNSYISEENEASRKARNEDRRNTYRPRVQQYANQIETEKEILRLTFVNNTLFVLLGH